VFALDPTRRAPLVVAHRGASGEAPENTFAAFQGAIEQGADALECDVHLSADGVPVVLHDHDLGRTTDLRGLVRDLTWAELSRADAGSWFGAQYRGERLPRLDDLLAWCRGRIPLSIELKNGPIFYTDLERLVVEQVREKGMVDQVSVISFDHPALLRLRAQEGLLVTGALYAARLIDGPGLARATGAQALLPHIAFVDRAMVEEAHGAGIAVSVWTVNHRDDVSLALAAGVDALATDFPARTRRLIDEAIGR